MSKSKFVWPCPVYQAEYADGAIIRLSFGWRVGKPIDPARGRRMCDLAYNGDIWRARHPMRMQTALEAYKDREKIEGVYLTAPRPRFIGWGNPALFRAEADFRVNTPTPFVRGFIEHPTLSRVEDRGVALDAKPKRKATPRDALKALRDLLRALDGDDRAPAIDVAFDNARRIAKAA